MKKIFFLLFFLTGCSAVLPHKKAEISDFVPKISEKKVAEKFKKNENLAEKKFDFAAKNFPKNCDWQKLVRVVDGDTLVFGENKKVRLIGIDTPETKHPRKKIEKFGPEASAFLKKILRNSKKICLIDDEKSDAFDQYQRRLAHVFSENGVDVAAEILQNGLAKKMLYFPFSRADEFIFYENSARQKKINLWEK